MKSLRVVAVSVLLCLGSSVHAEGDLPQPMSAQSNPPQPQSSASVQDESRSFTSIIRAFAVVLGVSPAAGDEDDKQENATSVSASNIDTALQLGPR